MAERTDHGWWPYWLPYVTFLVIVQFGAVTPLLLPLRVVAPLALLVYFARRGKYPELRGFRPDAAKITLDVLIGISSAAIWVAPLFLVPAWHSSPKPDFNPQMFGPALSWLTLLLRFSGFALVTPFMEELFIRSWLQRFVEAIGMRDHGFRDMPIAKFTVRSFTIVFLWFVFSHARHEWLGAAVWIVITQIWFYHRKHLVPMVITHAASNVALFLFVIFADGRIHDAQGNPLSLWFFL